MDDESSILQPRDAEPCSRGGARRTGGIDRAIGELADRQHGVVARRQLLGLGIDRGAIAGRIERGLLRRLHVGVYAVGHRALRREGRLLAAVLAGGSDAVLSHRSAGHLWGLLPAPPALPEVTRPRSGGARTGIAMHRVALRADEIGRIDRIPLTSPFRTLFDLAAILSRRQLERALHEAEVRQVTDRLSLHHLLARYPGRRGTRILRELLAADEPAGITQNEFEERFVAFLDSHGLPRPRFNATLSLRGRFLRPDCMWMEQRLIAQLDGRAAHGTAQAFESDRRRDRELLVANWRVAHITWWQLRDEPEVIAADLRRLLGQSASPAAER